jgi:hypothetical protein
MMNGVKRRPSIIFYLPRGDAESQDKPAKHSHPQDSPHQYG